jgi:crotonobetainyl-CoA:carnitine CoA-transferase CaiB-like acyl-CoA transferase
VSLFDSLRVYDCSTVLAGPSVGSFFAELGAKVTKFEHPTHKDVTRTWKLECEEADAPISAYFASINYKKEYKTVDFTNENEYNNFIESLTTVDILLFNFKPSDYSKFKLETAFLLSVNPSLIIGKISGFGEESDRVAYDLILQAETGFMSMNGTPESGPVKMPVALIDVLAAHHLKEGILTALLERTQTGKGKEVSVSLYDAALTSLANQASNFLMTNNVPKRIGSLHPNIAPYGELFNTKDGKTVTFAIGSDRHFESICTFLELTNLPTDLKFSSNVNRVINRNKLHSYFSEKIIMLNAKDIESYSLKHFIPFGIIKNIDEVLTEKSAQLLIRNEEIEGVNTKRMTQIAFR